MNTGDTLTLTTMAAPDGATRAYMGQPMPGDTFGAITIVSSIIFREADDEVEHDIFTVLLLNPTAPFYTVATLIHRGDNEYEVEMAVDHYNIVPAIQGDEYPNPIPGTHRMKGPRAQGYIDLGGSY